MMKARNAFIWDFDGVVASTPHEEAFYEGVYNPEEAEYAIRKIKGVLRELISG
ncbi:hypothetical protein IG193_00540 [Infirmifilum lucidum]|uniref:Uncharacterized protein n=1 Tax=Infirmifilum lucidum TaxID=2776706 RepID=A0A7L9FGV4_9CREN|nr:hypothetical protein [Infirmifilum lucidum]QOJ78989.1 hypothetical protein IG193_00540 [Infirmifilum lucidum]